MSKHLIKLSEPQEFTIAEIEATPDAVGVYVILGRQPLGHFRCTIVGFGNIRKKLTYDLVSHDPCINKMGATHFQYATSATPAADAEALTKTHRPVCTETAA